MNELYENKKYEELYRQLDIVKEQGKILNRELCRGYGDFKYNLLKDLDYKEKQEAISFWNL